MRVKLAASAVAVMLFSSTVSMLPGMAAGPVTTTLVSRTAGAQADRESTWPAVSSTGRFVAFSSPATNLVPNDTNGTADVFVADRATGAIERASVATNGAEASSIGLGSRHPAISADGSVVGFTSDAEGLATVPIERTQVFVRDRTTGTTTLISGDRPDVVAGAPARYPAVSADGRFVAFLQNGRMPGTEDFDYVQVFVHDRQAGTSEFVSLDYEDTLADDGVSDVPPAISSDGRFVAFASYSPDLSGPQGVNVFVRDRQEGTTTLVSVDSNEVIKGGGFTLTPGDIPRLQISPDGRYVLFDSPNAGLAPGDANGAQDVFLRDRQEGTTERVSLSTFSRDINGPSVWGTMSDDARYIAFSSRATDTIPGDTNGVADIFVRDRLLATTSRVSVSSTDAQAGGPSVQPAMSGSGAAVAFSSAAPNLVADDLNLVSDVFVRAAVPAPLPTPPVIITPGDGDIVRDAVVEVAGTADPDSTIVVSTQSGATTTTITDTAGDWNASLTLADGAHELRATATNEDGEPSGPSSPVAIRVVTGLIAPIISRPAADASLPSPAVQISGSADPGADVNVSEGASLLGSVPTGENGTWSITLSFDEGVHEITATASRAGEISDPSPQRRFTVDLTAPVSPRIDAPVEGAQLEARTIEVVGVADPGARVELLEPAIGYLGATVAGTDGAWSHKIALENGSYGLTARAVDRAGNVSEPSAPRAFVVSADSHLPEVAFETASNDVVLTALDGAISGTATDDRSIAGVSLHLRPVSGALIRSDAACNGCGTKEATWTLTPSVTPGRYTVTAIAQDAAGNRSRPISIGILIV